MKKIKRFVVIILALAIMVYVFGPKPTKPELNKDLPSISASIGNIDDYVTKKEAAFTIKPDNESRIFWADADTKERTSYCVLYLHGFSASWYEGYPAHVNFARKFGSNLYIPRLHDHGLVTEDPLFDMTPDALWTSAKEALMIARTLGRKVVIMSTSTGGTLALSLAAKFPEYVDGLILYSPNIRINDNSAFLLSKPWGLQLGRKSMGGKFRVTNEDFNSKDCQYWNCKYRVEALVYLQQLVEATMNKSTYEHVVAPVFLGYYYKDDDNQDKVVKVKPMLKMFDQLGTVDEEKVKMAFPEAGNHVIACELTSGSLQEVIDESTKFAQDIIGMKPIN